MTQSIDQLKSQVAAKGGVARPNNFMIELPTINGISGRDLNILARNVTMPGKQILTHEKRIGMEFQKVAYGYAVDDVSFTFLMLNDYAVKRYFDSWKNAILNEDAHIVNYKSEYAASVKIHQLANSIPALKAFGGINLGPISASIGAAIGNSLGGRIDITSSVYGVELIDAFPTSIGQVDFNNEQDGLIEMTVALSFTNWRPLDGGGTQFRLTL